MLAIKTSFASCDNSDTKRGSKSNIWIIGPVVVRQETARISASSNNIPNIARIIVTRAKLTTNNIKKIHAVKPEISRLVKLMFDLGIEEGCSNFPVSFEKAENSTDIRSSFIPPAVVANPPPNKHKPSKIIITWGIATVSKPSPNLS